MRDKAESVMFVKVSLKLHAKKFFLKIYKMFRKLHTFSRIRIRERANRKRVAVISIVIISLSFGVASD